MGSFIWWVMQFYVDPHCQCLKSICATAFFRFSLVIFSKVINTYVGSFAAHSNVWLVVLLKTTLNTTYGTHSKVFLLLNLLSFKLSVHISARRQRSRRQRVPFRHVGPRQDPHLGLQLHRRRDHGLRSGESNIYSSIDSSTKLVRARKRRETFPTIAARFFKFPKFKSSFFTQR